MKMSYLNTREISQMKSQQNIRERIIENFLYKYPTYKIGVKNCQKQLDYMMPSLTVRYENDGSLANCISINTEETRQSTVLQVKKHWIY